MARERSLQNMTNMFIVSLAVADLCVAGVVMPFYTYTMVSGNGFTQTFKCHKVFKRIISDQKLQPKEIHETTNKYKLPIHFFERQTDLFFFFSSF